MPPKKDTTKKGSTTGHIKTGSSQRGSTHDNLIMEMLRKNRKKRNPDDTTVKTAASMRKKK